MQTNKNNQEKFKFFQILIAIGFLGVGSFLFASQILAASSSERLDLNLQVNEGTKIIIYDVEESSIATNSATISWKTNFNAECELSYGKDTSYSEETISETVLRTTHSHSLSGLETGETYYYKIACESPIKASQERDGFDFETLLITPTFKIEIIGEDKVKISGSAVVGWKVYLIFSGEKNFNGATRCVSSEKWQYLSENLEPGKYYVKVYYENEDGRKSEYSTIQEFVIPERNVVKEEPKKETLIEEILPDLEKLVEESPLIEETVGEITATAETIGDIFDENKIPLTFITGAGLAAGALPFLFQLNSLKDIWLLFQGFVSVITGFFINRKRRDWGVVYDIRNGKPVPLAVVSIFNAEGRLAERKVTDSLGTYGFFVPSGRYSIRVEKKGYEFAPIENQLMSFYANSYQGNILEIKKEDVIRKDIPMKPISREAKQMSVKTRPVNFATGVIFFGGFLLSTVAFIVSPNILNGLILGIYLVSGAIRSFASSYSSSWGSIIGNNGIQASFAVIKAFDKATGKMIARTISDEHGRYYLILEPGVYALEVFSSVLSGQKWSGAITVKNRSAVSKKIKLG